MNIKIPIQEFSERLGREVGVDSIECQKIVKAIFAKCSDGIKADGESTIPGLGTFKVDIAKTVDFVADAEFCESVNAPFQAFEAVELSSEFEDEKEMVPIIPSAPQIPPIECDEQNVETDASDLQIPQSAEIHGETIGPEATTDNESAQPVANVNDARDDASDDKGIEPPPFNPVKAYAPSLQPIPEDEEIFVERPKRKRIREFSVKSFLYGLICGLIIICALAVLAVACYIIFFA